MSENTTDSNRTVPALFAKIRKVLPELEDKSYFELREKTKKFLKSFDSTPLPHFPKIEAWSFVLNPKFVEKFTGTEHEFKRFIVTIDTLRSNIYGPVLEFLQGQTANITSFFTGGWADFLCDIYMEESKFNSFLDELKEVMTKAGITKIEKKLDKVISIFEVLEKPLIICKQVVENLPKPASDVIEEVLNDRSTFETLYRNYMSEESLELFEGNEEKLEAYLKRLKNKGIIVCYKVVFDFSFALARDYVPMVLGTTERATPIDNFMEEAEREPKLLEPVRELVKVQAVRPSDLADRDVNYFFINEYEYPGEKQVWKSLVYARTDTDVNLYNYPLEGTLNDSPICLSDLPEFQSIVREYEKASSEKPLWLGTPCHPLSTSPSKFCLPFDGLSQHGITLGDPNTGKTNTDVVLIAEALKYLDRVVVLDSSDSIFNKIEGDVGILAFGLHRKSVSGDNVGEVVSEAFTLKGLVILEADRDEVTSVFSNLIKAIERLPDSTVKNAPRDLKNMLLVEEAGDVIGKTREQKKAVGAELDQLLTKAFRKGWCVWLSTQKPSQLGFDATSSIDLISGLQNRIVAFIKDSQEVQMLLDAFGRDNYSDEDLIDVREILGGLEKWTTLIRGVNCGPTGDNRLPAIKVKIRDFKVN